MDKNDIITLKIVTKDVNNSCISFILLKIILTSLKEHQYCSIIT